RDLGLTFFAKGIVCARGFGGAWRKRGRGGVAVCHKEKEFDGAGIRIARLAAGAVEIDLCAMHAAESESPLAEHLREATRNDIGGGIVGWVWGVKGASTADERESGAARARESILLPGLSEPATEAAMLSSGLPGVVTAAAPTALDIESRRQSLSRLCGSNANSVAYLEHIVVMTPVLEDAIAANEAIGVPCKRIREVGNGARQAF